MCQAAYLGIESLFIPEMVQIQDVKFELCQTSKK